MENNNIKEFKYGDDSNQFIRLYLPNNISSSSSSSSSSIIFIIIHGGFWKNKYTIDNSAIETLSPFLIEHDHPVCLIEYRRCSQDSDGGWPNTNKDVINGLNTTYKKCNELNMNIKKYILLGHSAGGTLALWSCCCLDQRELLFRPSLCVAIAPIGDLEEGQKKRLSDDGNAIQIYMGGKLPIDNNNNNNNNNEDPYKLASPSCNLPIMVPTIIVGGENDKDGNIFYNNDYYYNTN